MASFLANMVKGNTDISDEVIANNMIASAAAGAQAYLTATMSAATPELRAMYSTSINQMLGGHTVITELAIQKGWGNPYSSPYEQLSDAYSKSKNVLE